MLRMFVLALLAASTFAAPNKQSVEEQLTAKEQQLESFYADYWRDDYEVQQGNPKASTKPIQQQIHDVVDDSEFLRQLQAVDFHDPVLKRRRQLFLDEAAVDQVMDNPELSRLVESIRQKEAGIRYQVGTRRLTRGDVNNITGQDSDRRLRQQAWEARAQVTNLIAEPVRQAVKIRNALSVKAGGTRFPEAALARKGLTRKRVENYFEQIRSGSQVEYDALLRKMQRELHVSALEPWDLEYYFSTLTGASEERLFDREQAWPRIKRLAASLGCDFDRLPVQMKIADITFGGSTYPILYGKEVKILVNRYAGIRFTDTLLHEAGHALHYSFDDQGSFLLRANYSEPFDEGLGQVMALMLYRPEIATSYFGLSADQASSIRERYRLKSLYDMRELMADFLFELSFYDNPDQDLTALYNRIYSRLLGVNMHRKAVWGFDPFYASQPIYEHNYVLAEMFARQVHDTLEQRFSTPWGKDAGAFLQEQFFSQGARHTLDEILLQGTGEPLTPKYLIQSFKAGH